MNVITAEAMSDILGYDVSWDRLYLGSNLNEKFGM